MPNRNEGKLKTLDTYNKGLDEYRKRNFQTALKYFEEVLSFLSTDGPTKLYIDRCKQYIANPPPPDWDGVFTMTTK